jgi:protein PsiE
MSKRPILPRIQEVGNILVTGFHLTALFVIGGTIVWSAVVAYLGIMRSGYAQLHDILLLFIYLELGAMIGVYFKSRRLPVRFLVYVAITALTRSLTIDMKAMSSQTVVIIAGAILMLALAALTLQVVATRFAGDDEDT